MRHLCKEAGLLWRRTCQRHTRPSVGPAQGLCAAARPILWHWPAWRGSCGTCVRKPVQDLRCAGPFGTCVRRPVFSGAEPFDWAASMAPGTARLVLRQLRLLWLHSQLRMVDVMRASLSLSGRSADGCPVVMVVTSSIRGRRSDRRKLSAAQEADTSDSDFAIECG